MKTRTHLLLVNAPYPRKLKFPGQPTSLLYAAADACAWTENAMGAGSVRLVNYNLLGPDSFRKVGVEQFRALLDELQPRIVGISSTTASLPTARRLAAVAKEGSAKPLVILGGPHEDDVDCNSKTVLHDPNVDLSVSGDGETPLRVITEVCHDYPVERGVDVLDHLGSWMQRRDNIPLMYGTGAVVANAGSTSCPVSRSINIVAARNGRTLDKLPFAPRELLDKSEFFHYPMFRDSENRVKPTAQVMTARGCIKHCSFCSESQRLRQRSLESVVRELTQLRDNGFRSVFFDDSTMTNLSASRRHFIKELGAALVDLGMEWGCQTRVDCVDREILRDLAAGNCSYVYFGIESFSNEILKALGKGYSSEQIERTLDDCYILGIRVGASILLGAPDENHCSLETMDTARHTFCKVRQYVDAGPIRVVSLNLYAYYPGTRSTSQLFLDRPEIITTELYDRFEVIDEYPFNLLEENSPHCPFGLRERARDILLLADHLLHDVLSSTSSHALVGEIPESCPIRELGSSVYQI